MIIRNLFYFTFLFLSINSAASSVNYSLTPGSVIEDTAGFNTLSIYDIYQVNTSQTSIQLKWHLINMSIPQGWDYSICEFGTCYPGIPNGGTMDSVAVGDMGFLGLNINPYFVTGTAVVKVFIYENGYFSQGDTLTWIIHAITTSIGENQSLTSFNLFPNPVNESFSLSVPYDEFDWSVYDLSGKEILFGSSFKKNETLLVRNLDEGEYFVIINSKLSYPRRINFIKLSK